MKGSSVRPITRGWLIGCALFSSVLAGQVWAAGTSAINGKVTLPDGIAVSDAAVKVVATNEKNAVFTATVNDDGTYELTPIDNGTYRVVALGHSLTAAPVTNLVISDSSPTSTQNFDLKAPTPYPVVKSPNPIPLTDGIDSASFQDAPEIDLKSGESVAVGDPTTWGGPDVVSGRFKIKYSSLGLHIAGDVTYKTPRVNDQTGGNIWNANGLEIDFQNDAYDRTRTAYDNDHNWQLAVSLGNTPEWYLFGGVQAAPSESLASHFAIQDKTPNTGETFRLDIPWKVLVDSSGNPISEPPDNSTAAIDLALDAADPTQPAGTSTADSPVTRAYQLTMSGFADTWTNPSELMPIQFVAQAPAPTAGP